jgi:hypothetical protein
VKAWRWWAAVAAVFVIAGLTAGAATAATIVNGDFETGDFSGWTVAQNGLGAWGVTTNGSAVCGLAPHAPRGADAALWDMTDPSDGFLSQSFTVPANGTISVDYAYWNAASTWEQDLGGDPYSVALFDPNEWLRIDVIAAGAPIDTLDPSDIVATIFDSQSGTPTFDQDWTTGTVSLAAFAGQSVTFRVVVVNDISCLPVWIDNVSVSGGGAPAASVSHAGYCTVAGNTNPSTGAALAPGTFVNLALGQPDADPHYTGAVPAVYVEGKGITCDSPPAGYTQQGFAGNAQHVPSGVYPYYVPPGSPS